MSFSAAVAAFGGISSKISDEKSIAICESLGKKFPQLLERLKNLHERKKKRTMFDGRTFHHFVVDLVVYQTKNSLADRISVGHFTDICDPIRGCKCCDWFNEKALK